MSSRNIYDDQRVTVPLKPTLKYGRLFSLVSNGSNQQPGKPLEAHPYTMEMRDTFDALITLTHCTTGAARQLVASASCIALRAWSVQDDYKLYGKLEEKYDLGDFNAGVFAGELGETADMLADRVKQLGKAVRAAKKGNFAKAAKILSANGGRNAGGGVGNPSQASKNARRRARKRAYGQHGQKAPPTPRDGMGPQDGQKVSSGWLELQYGWLPLIGDIYSLSDQIAKADKPRQRRIRAQHWIGMTPRCNLSEVEAAGGGRVRKQIIAYITEDIPSWPEALGLTDPEIVAWELVPFSFVVDWFLPIGGYLQARAFASRAKGTFIVTSSTVYHARLTRSLRSSCPPPAGKTEKLELSSIGWGRYAKVARTVSTTLPQVPLPTFSNGLGKGWRLQNAIALAAEIFGGKKTN